MHVARSGVVIVGFGLVAAFATGCRPPQLSGDEDAVRAIIQALDNAWNLGDGTAWADHYVEDGEFINILGTVFEGREAIGAHHNEILNTSFKGSQVQSVIRRIEWLGPDVAIVDTDFYIRNFERLSKRLTRIWSDGSMRHRLKHIMLKRDDQWLIIASQNTPLMPSAP